MDHCWIEALKKELLFLESIGVLVPCHMVIVRLEYRPDRFLPNCLNVRIEIKGAFSTGRYWYPTSEQWDPSVYRLLKDLSVSSGRPSGTIWFHTTWSQLEALGLAKFLSNSGFGSHWTFWRSYLEPGYFGLR